MRQARAIRWAGQRGRRSAAAAIDARGRLARYRRSLPALLTDAFAARAITAVDDRRVRPTLRTGIAGACSTRRWLLVLMTLAGSMVLASCTASNSPSPPGETVTHTAPAPPPTIAATPPSLPTTSSLPTTPAPSTPVPSSSSSVPTGHGQPVQVSLQTGDGAQVGVGMPIIAYLSRPITDAKAFSAATKVTVNGEPVKGAWYFEQKYAQPGVAIEADYRLPHYWPAHAQIRLSLPVKGLSAGPGLVFHDSLTLAFSTGAANIAVVDDTTHTMTVTSDGKLWGRFPVSLGATDTPTAHGTKVIMEKGLSICMTGPGYHICHVKDTQRLTYGGEYLHAAPWNCIGPKGCTGPEDNIGKADSSNGCTNLLPADAAKLYHFLEVGDVVRYPNANGPAMTMGAGFGDWNVAWAQWLTGGIYPTSTA
jgi:lipoprotein-anchoring transpeptidase ErfK/SrfK